VNIPFKEQLLRSKSLTVPSSLKSAGRVKPMLSHNMTLILWTFILIKLIGSSPGYAQRKNGGIQEK
jgi:hypothetical protein